MQPKIHMNATVLGLESVFLMWIALSLNHFLVSVLAQWNTF